MKPWLPIAAQVLAGKWDKCDNSTRESLIIGLRGIPTKECQLAVERLENKAK